MWPEADELIALARRGRRKFAIGYWQRFNTKLASATWVEATATDGALAQPALAVFFRCGRTSARSRARRCDGPEATSLDTDVCPVISASTSRSAASQY
jgi:hypothetical protein